MGPLTLFLVLLFMACLESVNSASILVVIPSPCYSHQIFYQQLWRALALRGHDMVVVTTDPTREQLPNFREIEVKEAYEPMKEVTNTWIKSSIFELLLSNQLAALLDAIIVFEMRLPQIQQLIHNKTEHFDLVMLEHIPSLHMVFKHLYKCPMIGVYSLDAYSIAHEIMGNPVHGVLYPSFFLPSQKEMSFVQRMNKMVLRAVEMGFRWRNSARQNLLTREVFGEGIPDIYDLYDQTDMLFINANPLFSPVRPLTPSTINIAGGIHMKKPKPLPKDLQQFLDSTSNGVIYFSLGTNVKSMQLQFNLRQTLIDTFSQLPCKILWKYENDTLPGKPTNVKIIKWTPQQDVLRHPNVKLFISQGGLQSLEESLYCHVPMVVIPFMGDQESNAANVGNKGLGLKVNPHTLTVEMFTSAIMEVLNNPVYRDNVRKLAEQIQDEPMTPLEKAVWWTEYVLRHNGTSHLKGPRIPVHQYYYLDVLAFLGFVVLTIVGTLVIIMKITRNVIYKLFGMERARKVERS